MISSDAAQPSVQDLTSTERLSGAQRRFLRSFQESGLQRCFYLAGGAGLNAGYLGHRSVDDLDFFGPDNVPLKRLVPMMKALPGLKDLQWLLPRERTTFLITWEDDTQVKVEYRHFPFPNVANPHPVGRYYVASIQDLLADKIAALTERRYPLDRIDILMILDRLTSLNFAKGVDLAEVKFGLVGELKGTALSRMSEPAQKVPERLNAPEHAQALLDAWIGSHGLDV